MIQLRRLKIGAISQNGRMPLFVESITVQRRLFLAWTQVIGILVFFHLFEDLVHLLVYRLPHHLHSFYSEKRAWVLIVHDRLDLGLFSLLLLDR